MVTRQDLEKKAADITDISARIRLRRRYEVVMGSDIQGRSYQLLEFYAPLVHPTVTDIATTRLGALRYLEGFLAALRTVEKSLRPA